MNIICDIPTLWKEHKEALYYFILKRVGDENTAKDIRQDVLLKVYNFCCHDTEIRNVRSWLFQIAQNTITDHYRKQRRNVLVSEVDDIENEIEDSSFKDAAEFILPIIQLLPEIYSIPLAMSDVDGLSLKEIAASMNLGLSAIKQRVSRGRKLLKKTFAECCLMELDGKGRLVSFDIRPDCPSLQRYKTSLKKVH